MSNIAKQSAVLITGFHFFKKGARPQKSAYQLVGARQILPCVGKIKIGSSAYFHEYLTRSKRLMIHERKLSKKLVIDGPLTTCVAVAKATLNEIECSIAIQNEGFQNLVLGSSVTLNQVLERAPSNWYLESSRSKEPRTG
jgi:hypothetical protein